MASERPKQGDRAIYRGKFREIVGFVSGPDDPEPGAKGPVIVLQNPENGKRSWARTEDMRWSESIGAWGATGTELSRHEAALFSALMGFDQVLPPGAHVRALRILEDEDLDQELTDRQRERLEAFCQGYQIDPDEAIAVAKDLRAARQEVTD